MRKDIIWVLWTVALCMALAALLLPGGGSAVATAAAEPAGYFSHTYD